MNEYERTRKSEHKSINENSILRIQLTRNQHIEMNCNKLFCHSDVYRLSCPCWNSNFPWLQSLHIHTIRFRSISCAGLWSFLSLSCIRSILPSTTLLNPPLQKIRRGFSKFFWLLDRMALDRYWWGGKCVAWLSVEKARLL